MEIVKFEIYRTEDEGQEPNISNSPPSFLQDETTYIDFKVYLEHSPQKREFQIVHKYIDPFGNIVGEYSDDYYTEEDWTESWHTGGSGWDEPGNWDEGFYRIKVTVENKRYISEIFEICKEIESDEA
ncbi:MAG: hypothetical protein GX893_06065 [Firmicutes bacterium]|nr:hypothetical protein [Bacillota bacterium]